MNESTKDMHARCGTAGRLAAAVLGLIAAAAHATQPAASPAARLPSAPASTAASRPASPPASAPGACRALLVGGLPGTPVHARHYRDWVKRFRSHLLAAGVPAANVVVLSGDREFTDPIVRGPATAESIRQALADLARITRPQDQFILFMVGLGVTTEKVPMFVVPGPDLTARDLAIALAAVPARNQVILNFSASAGDFTPFLSRLGRAVLSANMPRQNVPPVYAEFFLLGLESGREAPKRGVPRLGTPDGEGAPQAGAKDGVITLLEAYNWAAFQTAQWIARQRKAGPGENAWRVDGAESVAIFRKLYVSAANEPGSRQLDPASDASRPDQIVRLKAKGEEDTEFAKSGRRVITEHAGLEDCGAEEPVSALGDEKTDYAPLSGRGEAEPGFLARRVVLGKPDLLPAKDD